MSDNTNSNDANPNNKNDNNAVPALEKPKLQIRVGASKKAMDPMAVLSPQQGNEGKNPNEVTQHELNSNRNDSKEDVTIDATTTATADPSLHQEDTTTTSTTHQQQHEYYHLEEEFDPKATFAAVNQIHTHHQSSSIHFTYNSYTQSWNMKGTTTMYISHTPKLDSLKPLSLEDTVSTPSHKRDMALHLRGGHGMKVTSAMVYLASTHSTTTDTANTTTVTNTTPNVHASLVSLQPVTTVVSSHFDPLQKILIRPPQTFVSNQQDFNTIASDKEYTTTTNNSNKTYEADTQYTRNSDGMMDALRCASIASNFGELRIEFIVPTEVHSKESHFVKDVWKNDLMESYTTSSTTETTTTATTSTIQQQVQKECHERDMNRRMKRIELISEKLSSTYLVDKIIGNEDANKRKGLNATMGLKLVLEYEMIGMKDNVHLGGIHFHTSNGCTKTPHVYTTSGTIGDHEGARTWIPTIDSASSKHRCTHELTIQVTAESSEGLWVAGCGEHFGVNRTLLHDIPNYKHDSNGMDVDMDTDRDTESHMVGVPSIISNGMQDTMEQVLGKSSVEFIASSFHPDSPWNKHRDYNGMPEREKQIHVIPPESVMDSMAWRPSLRLATSIWSSSIWNPVPSRSLGFAIGPFDIFYDPEYYSRAEDDDDDEDNDEEDNDDERTNDEKDDYPTISEAAEKKGEGIRQLYFAPKSERPLIHANAAIIGLEESIFTSRNKPKEQIQSEEKRKLLMSIIGSTAGVPNRALSLMRDILSLPAYRTSSYTQIWIPRAVDGGVSCGTLHACPEISCNPFLGGSIMDSNLLPVPGTRFPYYSGGRTVQLLQARCTVRGWITAAVPLGGQDDVGHSYILTLFEQFMMSLYERSHGAYGEGGSKHSFYHSKRFSLQSGLNSKNLAFFPVTNMEEDDDIHGIGSIGGLPMEEKGKDFLWRNANNGTESHTSSLDEFSIRQLLGKDFLEGIERQDKSLPSVGWLGSLLSATFFSSNSTSSSRVGCGAVELMHPVGGRVYRDLKVRALQKIIEGRCGPANFVRVIRAAFIASLLEDSGAKEVEMPKEKKRKGLESKSKEMLSSDQIQKPIFVICIDELIKKGGITHGSFIRSLKVLSGAIREPYLRGTLVDVSKESYGKVPSTPEGFPNSFVRGSSGLYLRVGTHIEPVMASESSTTKSSLLQVHILAEPVIPSGGISFGGPVTVRIIEKGGTVREFIKHIESDGSRSDWGPIFLHGEPVTTAKAQAAASGTAEATTATGKNAPTQDHNKQQHHTSSNKNSLLGIAIYSTNSAFDANQLHKGGFQALELARLTNCTPLLWVRIDPQGLFDGRVALFQQDACLGEQLFHDGDAFSQIEAIRALSERPLRVQAASKVKSVHDVDVSELPVRLLGDCLRGSVALYADLPHNPAVRAQSALAIAQWQNNKAPDTKDATGWLGLELLIQYLNERFFKEGKIVPCKYSRLCLKSENSSKDASNSMTNEPSEKNIYTYLDRFDDNEDRKNAIESATSVEREENEEYRVRSAVVTAIACIRAKDGLSPPLVLQVLKKLLEGANDSSSAVLESLEEEQLIHKKKRRKVHEKNDSTNYDLESKWCDNLQETPFSSSKLIASALLSLCYINASPSLIDDSTGKQVQSRAPHPCIPLLHVCYRWLEWDLYREDIQIETELKSLTFTGAPSCVAPCAITALSMLALLRQSTTDASVDLDNSKAPKTSDSIEYIIHDASNTHYYINIFDSKPHRPDATRAAAAQAILCLCCAADRSKSITQPVGLLTGLEFVMDRMLDSSCSPGLRQTLAMLMFDACTGKICSTQRVANVASCNDFIIAGIRQYDGPLGATYGSENGSSIHTTVGEYNTPAADAVNDGARSGFRLLRTAGQKVEGNEDVIVRVAKFASSMWRLVNGELGGTEIVCIHGQKPSTTVVDGICAHDAQLRGILLALLQWLWPKGCFAIMRVESWRELQNSARFRNLGIDEVMSINDAEKAAAALEDKYCEDLRAILAEEKDRQVWRGEMAEARRQEVVATKDSSLNAQGVNYPLEIVQKDEAWKLGSWVSSTAQQRRAKGADGGSSVSVTKLRLKIGGD